MIKPEADSMIKGGAVSCYSPVYIVILKALLNPRGEKSLANSNLRYSFCIF
jgi:hypothetical protein